MLNATFNTMENQTIAFTMQQEETDVETQYLIGLNKTVLLCFTTFGLYQVWWVYKAWRFFNQKDNLNLLPAVRTMFSIIFLPLLFTKVLRYAKQQGYSQHYYPILLFIGFFAFSLFSYLPLPFLFLSFLSVVFLIPVFKAFDFARRHTPNLIVIEQNAFNTRQLVLLIIGAVIWGFMLLGIALITLMPENV